MNGIKVLDTKNASAMPTVIKSLTVIGLVGIGVTTSFSDDIKTQITMQDGLLRFPSAKEALEVFKDKAGMIKEDLWDIVQQNVQSPIVISFVGTTATNIEKDPTLFYEVDALKSKVVLAVKNLELARSIWGVNSKVRIAIAPWYSHDPAIQSALESFNSGTKTVSVFDLNCAAQSEALTKLTSLGGMRQLAFPFYRRAYSVYQDATIAKPNSAVVAGHIAYWDANLGEFGFAFDHANRPIYDVAGVTVNLSYEEGEQGCSVNVIADAGGTVLLNDDGWKLYNFESPSSDARFNKLETLRFFDGLNENIQQTLKRHKHRTVKEVFHFAKADVDVFLGKAINAGCAIGAKVWWDERNTPSEISAGTIYMSYDAGNNVGIRSIVIQPYATDDYYADLIAENQIEEIKG